MNSFSRAMTRSRQAGKRQGYNQPAAFGRVPRLVEAKFVSSAFSASNIANVAGGGPNFSDLTSTVAQGTSRSTRIGDSIYIKSIILDLTVFSNVAGATSQTVRITCGMSKGAGVTSTGSPQNAFTGAPETTYYNALIDHRVTLTSNFYGANAGAPDTFHLVRKFPINQYITYDVGTTAAAHGQIFLSFISDVAANVPSVSGFATITFTDA